VRMVADVTETRIVIPSLEFKTYMTIKAYLTELFAILTLFENLVIIWNNKNVICSAIIRH